MSTPVKLGNEIQINAITSGYQSQPDIVVLSDGRLAATWLDGSYPGPFGATAFGVRAQVFNADVSIGGAPITVSEPNTYGFNGHYAPHIGASGDGAFLVATSSWNEYLPGPQHVTVLYQPAPVILNLGTGAQFGNGIVATSGYATSNFVIATQEVDAGLPVIKIYRFNDSGTQIGSSTQVNTSTASSQQSPEVARLSDGGFVVAWAAWPNTGPAYEVNFQRYDNTGNAVGANSTAMSFSSSGIDDFLNLTSIPDVAGLSGGNFVVVGHGSGAAYGDTFGSAVLASIVNSSGTVTSTVRVNTTTAGSQFDADVAGLPDGRFFVVWTDTSGTEGAGSSGSAIRGQLFHADGTKDGAEILINTFTADNQTHASVEAMLDGRIVVTWETLSNVLDTSFAGISAQILDPRAPGSIISDITTQWYGTTGTDVLRGTDAIANSLWGGGGNDFIYGLGNADNLYGNAGIDYIEGGEGNDALYGGEDGDNLQGGNGADYLLGGLGHDFLFGLAGDDVLYGDSTEAEAGIDVMLGGDGNDALLGLSGSDVLYGEAGIDTLLGGNGVDWLFGGAANDVLYGGADQDFLYGGAGSDWMIPEGGIDYLYFENGAGVDTVLGWTDGEDFIVFNNSASMGVKSIADLAIADGNGYTAITYGGNLIFVLGASASQFDSSDFFFA